MLDGPDECKPRPSGCPGFKSWINLLTQDLETIFFAEILRVEIPVLSDAILTNAMRHASALAREWIGATSPNPPVGAVALDAEGAILAAVAHQRAGGMHAEAAVIELCRAQNLLPKIATLCVTLEPCNHQGRTPPCTEALIRSGIQRIAIGTRDPNRNVIGGGVERLQQAGIEVLCGVAEAECQQLIHAFAYNAQTGKPWITIKRAFDRKGSMIPAPGQRTFTSTESLLLAHRLRKKADAIITSSRTILVDNPLFNVRHVPDYPAKRRWLAILDRRGQVSENYLAEAIHRGLDPLISHDIKQAIADLAAHGAQDILVEAGPTLSQDMLDSGLWTMSVAIHQGDPDLVEVEFNRLERLPFPPKAFRWEAVLPS
jgi:diaminohydroxyphosphoribosylaminopyrimidine deaminase / 5-amino-6-(5-phosphoribosylamino)uracil reductase